MRIRSTGPGSVQPDSHPSENAHRQAFRLLRGCQRRGRRRSGIAYLCGGGFKEVVHTVVNALAIVSGIVCDGAKASCAAKIASAVDAGILGYNMYIRGQQFYGGDGIVTKGVEATLKNVGRLGKEGMKETNEEIIKIMIGE